jgi:hypothetical protein
MGPKIKSILNTNVKGIYDKDKKILENYLLDEYKLYLPFAKREDCNGMTNECFTV